MTKRNGRHGRRYNRAGMADPRGSWAPNVPASAGFYPAKGVKFSGTEDPLQCQPAQRPCDEGGGNDGRTFSSTGIKLSRHGAPKTRLRHGLTKKRRFAATSLKSKSRKRGLRFKSRKG